MKPAIRYASKGLLVIILSMAMVMTGCSTSWIQTALNDLPILVQIATSVIGIVGAAQGKGQIDPALASQIQTVSAQVKSDLQLVQNLVTSYQSASASAKPGLLTQIDTALSTVQTNLNALLSAFHVNNAALQATITASIGLAITTVLAIQSLVPAPPAPTPASMKAHSAGPVQPMAAKQLKASFNAIVNSNGYGDFAIQ